MQNRRYVFTAKPISFAFLVLWMIFVVFSSNAIADDHHNYSSKQYDPHKYREIEHEIQDDEGNELTGESAAWLFVFANLPVLLGLLYRGFNRFGSLTENAKERFKAFKKVQKKYLMPFHYLINVTALLLATIHFSLSSCRSTFLPELGLGLMACIVVLGIMLKINATPRGARRIIYKIHTNPLTVGLVVSVLLIGHNIMD